METKICSQCQIEKSIDCFLFLKTRNCYDSRCKPCNTIRTYEWRQKNKERHKKYDRDYKREYLRQDPFKRRCHNIKRSSIQHAKSLNLPMELTEDDFKTMYDNQDGKCYYTGIKMKLDSFNKDLLIMSCDRKDSTLGYIKSNVVLCCWGINILKGRNSIDELYQSLSLFYDGAKKMGKIKPSM